MCRFLSKPIEAWSSLLATVLVIGIHGCGPVEISCPPWPMPEDGQPCERVYTGEGNPFDIGPLATRRLEVAQCEQGAPRELFVFAPQEEGFYAVVVFQHGFMSRNAYYSQMLEHIASHGFVVVAPQMYRPGLSVLLGRPSAAEEAEVAARIIEWLPGNLDTITAVRACTDRLGISGHSRGGKVAWLVMARHGQYARAIAGVDPVDGTGGPFGGQDRVTDAPFPFSVPALVIGAGRGGRCAPVGDNYARFYEASASPAWQVLALEQGHADMLDDETPGFNLARSLCPGGPDTEGMRRLTAGLLVALFRASLQGDQTAYAYLNDADAAPVKVAVTGK